MFYDLLYGECRRKISVDVKYNVNVVGMKVKDLLSISGGNLYRYESCEKYEVKADVRRCECRQ